MAYKVEQLTERLELGEGPHWDQDTQSLYFVDIFGKSVHKYTPSTRSHAKAVIGDKTVSFIIPIEGRPGKFVISSGNELALIDWDGVSDEVSNFESLVELRSTDELEARWNDAKADASGRLWAGVMYAKKGGGFAQREGNLYTLEEVDGRKTLRHQLGSITVTNGLAWDYAMEKFYYIDSEEGEIYRFDYDAQNGGITNQEVVSAFKRDGIPGIPDGMTIDADGNLWVASFNSYSVVKIDPRRPGAPLQTVEMPAKQVTSVAFGGTNLDELYVTTAKAEIAKNPRPEGPQHGALYRVTGLGAKGLPPYKVKL